MGPVYENIIDVGDEVAGFTLDSQLGSIFFREIIDGKWALLVTFGKVNDPVATTDLAMLVRLMEEFKARNIFVAAIGCDSVPSYRTWIKEVDDLQSVSLNYALLSDPSCSVLRQFGCARENIGTKICEVVSHGVFLIDTEKRVRFSMRSSPFVGRNFYEVIRQFDALMMVTTHPIVCPCNWGQGQQVLIRPDVTGKEIADYRYSELKPWFKLAPCPDKL